MQSVFGSAVPKVLDAKRVMLLACGHHEGPSGCDGEGLWICDVGGPGRTRSWSSDWLCQVLDPRCHGFEIRSVDGPNRLETPKVFGPRESRSVPSSSAERLRVQGVESSRYPELRLAESKGPSGPQISTADGSRCFGLGGDDAGGLRVGGVGGFGMKTLRDV